MKIILLDAYNVIHKIPELSVNLEKSLRAARRALLAFMVDWKQINGYKGSIYIVYDGQDDIVNSEGSKLWGIKCFFTGSKEEADERIISMVERARQPAEIVVISEDGKVNNGCKVHGAKVENPVFLRSKRKKKSRITEARSKQSLSGKDQREVDTYYKEALGLD